MSHVGNDHFYKLKIRDTHLKEMEEKNYDLVIIGGGCNGAGVFLEGASRGLKCALIDQGDFAGQTSSKSTKLIHGGIRYLYDVFEFKWRGGRIDKYNLISEALQERTYFVENAYYMNK